MAYDLSPNQDWDIVPIPCYDHQAHAANWRNQIAQLNNSYWLTHGAMGSKAKVVYGSVYKIPQEIGPVDISTFGSILLHVRDPFQALYKASLITQERIIVTNPQPTPSSAPTVVPKQVPKIVAFGDSLTAGLGLTAGETYPAKLQTMLDTKGFEYEVVNAGVSGDTSTGGLRRMDWVLDDHVQIVVLELGANDILRGLSIQLMKENLGKMIEAMQSRGITVVLAGMEAPTNSGPEYRKEVHDAYRELADKYQTPFIPFILEGVVQSEKLIQEDLSHPNPEGAKILAKTVFDTLSPLLKKASKKH